MVSKNLKGIICIVFAACCWGFFPSFSRVLYAAGIPVIQVVAARAFIAAAVYACLGFVRGTFKGLTYKSMWFFFLYGMAAIFSTYLFYALSIRYLSAATAAMLLYTAPVFVILFSSIFFGEKITKVKVCALLLTFIGSFFVVRAYDFTSLKMSGIGILFGFLSGIGYSMLTVVGRMGLKKYSVEANTYLPTMMTAAVLLFTFPMWEFKPLSPVEVFCILGVGIIGSVLPYLLYMKGLSYGIPGGNAALLANVEPLVAAICGMLFFKDILERLQIMGIVLVLMGAVVPNVVGKVSQKSAHKRKLFSAKMAKKNRVGV